MSLELSRSRTSHSTACLFCRNGEWLYKHMVSCRHPDILIRQMSIFKIWPTPSLFDEIVELAAAKMSERNYKLRIEPIIEAYGRHGDVVR